MMPSTPYPSSTPGRRHGIVKGRPLADPCIYTVDRDSSPRFPYAGGAALNIFCASPASLLSDAACLARCCAMIARTAALIIAARYSPARTSIIVENPADRSPGASIASSPEFAKHGSLFRTSHFIRVIAEADLSSHVTFAYCRLKSEYQKYTTLYYTIRLINMPPIDMPPLCTRSLAWDVPGPHSAPMGDDQGCC